MKVFAGLLALWLVGLGFALILGQQGGARAYARGTVNAIGWLVRGIFRLVWRLARWGWTRHREGFIGFLLGLLVGILIFLL